MFNKKKNMLEKSSEDSKDKVGIKGYLALAFGICFFSGIFSKAQGPWRALDLMNIIGQFGTIGNSTSAGIVGTGGSGVREAFFQAISFAPVMAFSIGVVTCIEYLGGLKAAQKLLTPILKVVMGVPGCCGLAMIMNWQSSDASAAEARRLLDTNQITSKERDILVSYEFIAEATIGVFFSNGAILFPHITCSTGIILLWLLIVKFIAANLMRLYLYLFER